MPRRLAWWCAVSVGVLGVLALAGALVAGVSMATVSAVSGIAFMGLALYRWRLWPVESLGWLLLGLSSALNLPQLAEAFRAGLLAEPFRTGWLQAVLACAGSVLIVVAAFTGRHARGHY